MMRSAITTYLEGSPEATARNVAAAVGIEIKDALKELNAMLRDGCVERENRGGNEYAYWLAAPSNQVEKAEVSKADHGDSEGGEADLRRQIEFLEFECKKLSDSFFRAMSESKQAFASEADKHERMLQAVAEADNLRADRDAMKSLVDEQRREIEKLKAERDEAGQAVDILRAQIDAIPTVEAHTAGYLVRAPKRKPAIVTQGDAAVKRAMAAARNGSGRADVYALVLTGTARRGAEWSPA